VNFRALDLFVAGTAIVSPTGERFGGVTGRSVGTFVD
jgi:hypothetical protein